jgi:hypothetical protein
MGSYLTRSPLVKVGFRMQRILLKW